MNVVLDDVKEIMRGILTPTHFAYDLLTFVLCEDDEGNETTRSLGLVVARGTLLVLISPMDGSEEIANPFIQDDDDDDDDDD
jgi:U6 snRNA-associated Sm-like protein LSm7